MLPAELQVYLDECIGKSLAFELVEPHLVASGWKPEVISQAKIYYASQISAAATSPAAPIPPSALPAVDVIAAAPASKPAPAVAVSRSRFPLVIFAVIMIIVFVLAGTGVSSYLVATDRIAMPESSLKSTITNLVFSLPFVEKTPRFLLAGAIASHQDLSRHSFDLSLASNSNDFKSIVGGSNLDVQVKGYLDYSRVEEPHFSLTGDINKDLSLEARKSDKMLYIKINKLPVYLMSMLGVDPANASAAYDSWIAVDTSPLDTEARDIVSKNTPSRSGINEVTLKAIRQIADTDVTPYLKVSTETLDGARTHKLDYVPTPDQLNTLFKKLQKEFSDSDYSSDMSPLPSEVVSEFHGTVWIDDARHYVSKISISMTINPAPLMGSMATGFGSPVTSGPVTVALVLKLSDYGKEIPVTVPGSSITAEEFYSRIFKNSVLNPSRAYSQSNNARRTSDIHSLVAAIYMYAADNQGKLPGGITSSVRKISRTEADICSSLVNKYLMSLPVDPGMDPNTAVTDCTSGYDTGYTIVSSSSGRITVAAPGSELGDVISITR